MNLHVVFYVVLFFFQLPNVTLGQEGKPAGDQPNIIFILTDDQRWDALGYAGNTNIQTPEMDKLASEGVYFKNAMVTTPICAASRASILTGLYERTHKYTFQTGALKEEYVRNSYPNLLKSAGYYTGFYGKFGVTYGNKEALFDVIEDYDRNNRFKDRRGYYYKELEGDTVHLTRYTGERALQFIESAPTDKPFSLSLSFSAPHAHDGAEEQYFWQEEPGKLYQDVEMPGPSLGADEYFDALPEPVRAGFNRVRWKWRYDTPEKYQHSVKGYYRMIKGIDLEIAKIRKKLAEKGMDRNTVIVLMGDNGYFLGERQLAGKWLMYDNSVRVPLMIYDPRVGQHRDVDEMVLNIDVPSTIMDLAGIRQPESWHGKSLMPLVTSGQSLDRDTILIEHLWDFVNIPPSEGVRTKRWKYMRYINDKTYEELYDLTNDPQETKNLAKNPSYHSVLFDLQTKNDELGRKYADPFSGVPTGLMVEYLRDPEGTTINDPSPEFSWVVPSEAVLQKGYQVLVSSSREGLVKNVGDVWDSGAVRGAQSSNIELQGKSLKPNTEYFWKTRIWDQDNRLSEYSEVQSFTTGLLQGKESSGKMNGIRGTLPGRSSSSGIAKEESGFSSSDPVLDELWLQGKDRIKFPIGADELMAEDPRSMLLEPPIHIIQVGHYVTDMNYATVKQEIASYLKNSAVPIEWQLQKASILLEDYYYTEDIEFLRENYESVKESIIGVVGKDVLLKSPGTSKTTMNSAVLNGLLYKNLIALDKLAGVLKRVEDESYFEFMASQVKVEVNEKLFNKERGLYLDEVGADNVSASSNVILLAFDIVPDGYKPLVKEFVAAKSIDEYNSGFPFVLEGLFKAGQEQLAFDILRSISRSNANDRVQNRSDWHAMPTNTLTRFAWGIQPAAPGFKIARIDPRLGDLEESKIKVPTMLGAIEGTYEVINDRYTKYSILLPSNMVGEFVLNLSPQAVVTLNGVPVNLSFGNIRLGSGLNEIELRINSF